MEDKSPKIMIGPPLSEREKVFHLSNRMAFGTAPGDIDQALKATGHQSPWQTWVHQQLNPAGIDDSALDKDLAGRFPWIGMSIQELRDKYAEMIGGGGKKRRKRQKFSHQDTDSSPQKQLCESVLYRAVYSKRQFNEVICEFWRNHFCVDQPDTTEKSRSWTDADYEQQVVRKFAFAKFKNMLYASATHPAMLEYLDNALSKANAWNENYAREVMELHTLGADNYYTDNDVRELAKILTGWTYDHNYQFEFKANEHQPGPKHFLGAVIPQGFQGGQLALYMLATHHGTADFIALQLCRYLVNDNPPALLVRRVAAVFRDTEGDLPKVYLSILNSPEYFGRENYRAKFKTPFAFTVSALRVTDAKLDDAQETCRVIGKMGQPIYNCPDPTGYRFQAESWMDAGVLTSRWDYAWKLLRGSIDGVRVGDVMLKSYADLKPADMQRKMVDDLIGGDIGERERKMLTDAGGDTRRMLSILLGAPSFQQE